MKVLCKYDELVPVTKLKPSQKNRNKHPDSQVKRLAKILAYQGIRAPIIVSTLSGCMVKGHGTLLAIKENKWTEAPVVYQDFESEEQQYAFIQSDNAIAEWAELDLASINMDLAELGPEFDIDMLGIENFVLEPADKQGDGGERIKLADLFLVPPFSVLDARQGYWLERKREWLALGIKSELGRGGGLLMTAKEVTTENLNYYRNRQP